MKQDNRLKQDADWTVRYNVRRQSVASIADEAGLPPEIVWSRIVLFAQAIELQLRDPQRHPDGSAPGSPAVNPS